MIEQFNALNRVKKLELLYKAEAYINALRPVAEKEATLLIEKEEKEQTLKKDFENIGGGKTAVRIFLGISIVLFLAWLILPEGFLSFMAMFCLIPSVLVTVVTFFMVPGYKKTYEAKAARLKELEPLIAAARKETDAVKQQHNDGFSIWYTFCREYASPQDIRSFIYFFESGRADTLKEAKNLFAQKSHQDHLEQLTQEQIEVAEAARRAANEAASAARSAAAAASAAKTSSDAAWWEVKKNS